MTGPMPGSQEQPYNVNKYCASVAFVEAYCGSAPHRGRVSAGTGFFFQHSGRTYLVTCRHVLLDEHEDVSPDLVEFDVHCSGTEIKACEKARIELYTGSGAKKWRDFVDWKDRDVAAIDETDELMRIDGRVVVPWRIENVAIEEESIEIGDPLFAICYPLGFHDIKNKLPVIRSATLASSYGVDFNGRCEFLIDAKLHDGTSGCPVVRPPVSGPSVGLNSLQFIGGALSDFLLVGINVAEYRGEGPDKQPVGLDLHSILYPRALLELLNIMPTGNVIHIDG